MRKTLVIILVSLLLGSMFVPILNALIVTQNVTVKVLSGIMELYSPIQNKIYSNRMILINLSIGIKAKYIKYSDNGGSLTTLCVNCDSYSKVRSFSDGKHNLTFIGIMTDGQNIISQSSFLIDSIKPQISSTEPRSNSFTNGSNFLVKYNEANLINIDLIFNNSKINNSCLSGKQQCSFNPDLSQFNNQEIQYYFNLTDIAGNTAKSRIIKVHVDTISPIINNPNSFWNQSGKYINFNISINETNFDSVNYMDNSIRNPRLITLCSSLNKGYCIKKVYFNTGNHNLTIQILDKADNSIQKNINFTV